MAIFSVFQRQKSFVRRWSYKELVTVFSIIYFVAVLARAVLRPLWYDEIFTVYIARLNGPVSVWNALRDGVDLNPPLYYWLVQVVHLLVPNEALAARLPSAIGFWMACIFVLAFTSRRVALRHAVVALLYPFCTMVHSYASEGRAYGVVLGCGAAALFCWQTLVGEEDEPGARNVSLQLMSRQLMSRRRQWAAFGLWASIAIAVSCHYLAVLLVLPIAVGEATRWWTQRKTDGVIWLMLLLGALVVLCYLPLMLATLPYRGAFWAKATPHALYLALLLFSPPLTFHNLHDVQALILHNSSLLLCNAALFFILWAAVESLRMAYRVLDTKKNALIDHVINHDELPGNKGFFTHELAAALAFALLPFLLYGFARLTQTVFTPRYVLSATIGCALLLGALSWKMEKAWRSVRLVAGIVKLLVVAVSFLLFSRPYVHDLESGLQDSFRSDNRLLLNETAKSSTNDLPIVIMGERPYMMFHYNSAPELHRRVVFLADVALCRQSALSDTGDLAMLSLSRWAPLTVQSPASFLRSHFVFLVYKQEEVKNNRNWIEPYLRAQGYVIRLQSQMGNNSLFRVTKTTSADAEKTRMLKKQ